MCASSLGSEKVPDHLNWLLVKVPLCLLSWIPLQPALAIAYGSGLCIPTGFQPLCILCRQGSDFPSLDLLFLFPKSRHSDNAESAHVFNLFEIQFCSPPENKMPNFPLLPLVGQLCCSELPEDDNPKCEIAWEG